MTLPTDRQAARIEQAQEETLRLIEKELNYSPDLRKADYLEKLRAHFVKLQKMLDTGEGLPK